MRFEIGMKAVMLSIATLGSGGVLAAGIAQNAPVLGAAQVQAQPAKRAPVNRVKENLRADVSRKKAGAAKVQAVPAVASTPASPLQDDDSGLTLPAPQDEVPPADNRVHSLALKGVRG